MHALPHTTQTVEADDDVAAAPAFGEAAAMAVSRTEVGNRWTRAEVTLRTGLNRSRLNRGWRQNLPCRWCRTERLSMMTTTAAASVLGVMLAFVSNMTSNLDTFFV